MIAAVKPRGKEPTEDWGSASAPIGDDSHRLDRANRHLGLKPAAGEQSRPAGLHPLETHPPLRWHDDLAALLSTAPTMPGDRARIKPVAVHDRATAPIKPGVVHPSAAPTNSEPAASALPVRIEAGEPDASAGRGRVRR